MRGPATIFLLVGLVGCGTGPGHRGVPTLEPVTRVSVFYATDRAASSSEPDRVQYEWRRAYSQDEGCELGVCQIEIRRERNHDKAGPLPKSSAELISVVTTNVLPRQRFYERLREKMWYADENETFVFVHGFNNSFEDAAKRTAEIWYDVGFEGPPIMYSWPSQGSTFLRGVFGYFADSETVKWSVADQAPGCREGSRAAEIAERTLDQVEGGSGTGRRGLRVPGDPDSADDLADRQVGQLYGSRLGSRVQIVAIRRRAGPVAVEVVGVVGAEQATEERRLPLAGPDEERFAVGCRGVRLLDEVEGAVQGRALGLPPGQPVQAVEGLPAVDRVAHDHLRLARAGIAPGHPDIPPTVGDHP